MMAMMAVAFPRRILPHPTVQINRSGDATTSQTPGINESSCPVDTYYCCHWWLDGISHRVSSRPFRCAESGPTPSQGSSDMADQSPLKLASQGANGKFPSASNPRGPLGLEPPRPPRPRTLAAPSASDLRGPLALGPPRPPLPRSSELPLDVAHQSSATATWATIFS